MTTRPASSGKLLISIAVDNPPGFFSADLDGDGDLELPSTHGLDARKGDAIEVFVGFTTSLWPLPSLRNGSRFERIESLCFLFMIVSYGTHLSWELVWLTMHNVIARSGNQAWAYPWWAYIDGGALRYRDAPATLFAMEVLSVLNGAIGATGLVLWYRSKGIDSRSVFLFMATAVVHRYSTSLYFGSEIFAGLPNVDTSSFLDSYIKFGLVHAPWIVFPWFVLYWGVLTLGRSSSRREVGME